MCSVENWVCEKGLIPVEEKVSEETSFEQPYTFEKVVMSFFVIAKYFFYEHELEEAEKKTRILCRVLVDKFCKGFQPFFETVQKISDLTNTFFYRGKLQRNLEIYQENFQCEKKRVSGNISNFKYIVGIAHIDKQKAKHQKDTYACRLMLAETQMKNLDQRIESFEKNTKVLLDASRNYSPEVELYGDPSDFQEELLELIPTIRKVHFLSNNTARV